MAFDINVSNNSKQDKINNVAKQMLTTLNNGSSHDLELKTSIIKKFNELLETEGMVRKKQLIKLEIKKSETEKQISILEREYNSLKLDPKLIPENPVTINELTTAHQKTGSKSNSPINTSLPNTNPNVPSLLLNKSIMTTDELDNKIIDLKNSLNLINLKLDPKFFHLDN